MTQTGINRHDESFSVGECDAAVGESIRWLRQFHNLTRVDVAQKLGVTEPELDVLEVGRLPVTYALARQAAKALGMSLIQFVAYVETVLTKKPRAVVEYEIPHTDPGVDAMCAVADASAVVSDLEYRRALAAVVSVFGEIKKTPP